MSIEAIVGAVLLIIVAVEVWCMWGEKGMDVSKLMTAEIELINKLLMAHGIQARVKASLSMCVDSGFVAYGLSVMQGEKIGKIELIQRELSNALTTQRANFGPLGKVPVRISDYPLAIEVPHPEPVTLRWDKKQILKTPKHAMLLGRSYVNSGQNSEIVSFDEAPHSLIAGITGAGKSVLLQMMMLSLCYNTPSSELEIVLIDLKNEDMLPFKKLPHVKVYAGTKEKALSAIQYVVAEKEKRISREGYKPYRLVLWIDELAQLASMKDAAMMLGDLASIGRGKLINLVGATQYPTEKGGLGGLLKANFPIRLVGMVAPGQSHIATGRPQTHADMLPGRGSFLRCQGPTVQRFQSYHIEHDEVVRMVSDIWDNEREKAGYAPVTGGYVTGYEGGYDRLYTSEREPDAITGYDNQLQGFPINTGRTLTESEGQAVRRLAESGGFDYSGKLSLSRLTLHVYGSKNADRMQWVKEALEKVSI